MSIKLKLLYFIQSIVYSRTICWPGQKFLCSIHSSFASFRAVFGYRLVSGSIRFIFTKYLPVKFISVDAWYIYVLCILLGSKYYLFPTLLKIWFRYIISWRRALQPTWVFLSRESHGQRNLVGYSPWCRKELDMTEAIEHIPHHILTIHRILESGLLL